ncbi:SRPBCC family protein [Nocardioides sp.]|uniref:SRPBCC family protein n=1 Tax=Nocardioides sp. TaxID=35761 RepID=UPI0031FE4A5E|nr:cyclase/dehydrase [Nocardioides sp.]
MSSSSTEQTGAARELRAEATVDAAPDQVWRLLTDFGRMPEWSPELVMMVPLKPGGLRLGQWYLGVNRRKAALWPTRSVVARLEPGRVVAWDTTSSGARWIWEVSESPDRPGTTRVVHRRPVPRDLTKVSRMFAPVFLGGNDSHADELEAGMQQTVDRLKAAVEGS